MPDFDDHGTAPIPEGNQPGHHPDHEQDKPDLDKFAQRLGLVPDLPADPVIGAAASVPVDQLVPVTPLPANPVAPETGSPADPRDPADPVDALAGVLHRGADLLEGAIHLAVRAAVLPFTVARPVVGFVVGFVAERTGERDHGDHRPAGTPPQ